MKKILLLALMIVGLSVSSVYAFGERQETMREVLESGKKTKTSKKMEKTKKKFNKDAEMAKEAESPKNMLGKPDKASGVGSLYNGPEKKGGNSGDDADDEE